MKNFRSFELAAKFYKETKLLPLKGSAKDKKKFFNIAMLSAKQQPALSNQKQLLPPATCFSIKHIKYLVIA